MELDLLIFHGSSGELVTDRNHLLKHKCHDKRHALNYLGICKELRREKDLTEVLPSSGCSRGLQHGIKFICSYIE